MLKVLKFFRSCLYSHSSCSSEIQDCFCPILIRLDSGSRDKVITAHLRVNADSGREAAVQLEFVKFLSRRVA